MRTVAAGWEVRFGGFAGIDADLEEGDARRAVGWPRPKRLRGGRRARARGVLIIAAERKAPAT